MIHNKIIEFDIPVVDSHSSISNPETFIESTYAIQGSEGVVVAWDSGYRVKAKGEWYCNIHKAKDNILREKGVIEMLLDEKADDVKAFLPVEDVNRLNEYETAFWKGVAETAIQWQNINQQARIKYIDDRKSFALEMAPTIDHLLRGRIFKAWDNPNYDWRNSIIETIRLNLGTQSKVDATRHLWGGVSWGYNAEETE